MPINTDLLIAAPILQDAFVDKNGLPMAGGTVTCYHDNSRTTLKNWYYQSGTPGNYTYITLPNPLTLSAAGTITDINGVDTIPFFYPYSEIDDTVRDPYYITIVNFFNTNQITRANFPFLGTTGGNSLLTNSLNNLITNGGFWRNIQPNTLVNTPFTSVNLKTATSLIVAPSQHDGFRFPDITFIKNNTSAEESVTFIPFPLGNMQPILNYIVPEYYASHVVSMAGTGETQKCYQFPISLHVNTLANIEFTATIQAQNIGGSGVGQNVITLFIFQDTGTGTTPPISLPLGKITLDSSWTSYNITGIFPATAGLVLGQGSDDGLYLQVQMPLNMICSINFTKPSIFLTQDVVPNNDFQTYDEVDTVINSPRTGDIRTSLNSFYPYGWVAMNDGVIGLNAMSVMPTLTIPGYSRANNDTWQLFNLLWSLAVTYDSGSNFNPICQMYTNTGSTLVATNFGANAYADFTANNALALTKMFGHVMMGGVPFAALFPGYGPQSQGLTASNVGGNLSIMVSSISSLWNGAPIVFNFSAGGSLPGNIVLNAVYYATVVNVSAGTFLVATTFANAMAGTPVVAFSSAGSLSYIDLDITGTVTGQNSHVQLESELATHSHPGSTAPMQFFNTLNGTVGTARNYFVAGGTTAITVAPDGSSAPFNIVQPATFYNMFMKL
jgi:hypothetical protein